MQNVAASGVVLGGKSASGAKSGPMLPSRKFGKTDLQVSVMGLGGFHLGAADTLETATKIVQQAINAGINFFDNAWEYHDGRSEEWLGAALGSRRKDVILMTKVCSHGRTSKVAMRQLEESLRRLRTDHLDVWQIHEVIYESDPDLIFVPGGTAEALLDAKKTRESTDDRFHGTQGSINTSQDAFPRIPIRHCADAAERF